MDLVKLAIQKLAPNVLLECVQILMSVQITRTHVFLFLVQYALTFQIDQVMVYQKSSTMTPRFNRIIYKKTIVEDIPTVFALI